MNNWLISVIAETSQAPIGPCGPLEQSVGSCRHSFMAAWSSALDFGAHPVAGIVFGVARLRVRVIITVSVRVQSGGYTRRSYTVEVRARVQIMISVGARLRALVRVYR